VSKHPVLGGQVDDDLLARDYLQDPYPRYRLLRAEDPVHWNSLFQFWEITRYEDVVHVLRHPELFSSEYYRVPQQPPPYPPFSPEEIAFFATDESKTMADPRVAPSFILQDPPAHTAKRALIHRYFASTAMARWRPLIQSATNDLLDAAEAKGSMEFMTDVATPLPFLVIARMLEIPNEDKAELRELVELSVSLNGTGDDRLFKSVAATRKLDEYLGAVIREREKKLGDDLLSLLIRGKRDGVLTENEVISNTYTLFVAGHETTLYFLGNGVLALLRHPEQWERLRADPDRLAASATEECLRYDSSVYSAVPRVATQDVELGGKVIRKDEFVRYVLPSANRDEAVFDSPAHFDITRNPNRHIAFATGIHTCLGMTAARIEGQEVFKALAKRFPGIRMAGDEVEYVPNTLFRGIRSLPLVWN
jgi:cytochrome P450